MNNKSSIYSWGARFYEQLWGNFTNITIERTIEALGLNLPSAQNREVKILDIGCGTGELEKRIASRYPGVRIVGVDSSSEMLAKARQKLRGKEEVSFQLGDANSRLPFAGESFNSVVSSNCFHYFVQPSTFLEEAGRVLKPGGSLVIEDFTVHGNYFWPIFEKILHLVDRQHQKTYSLKELKALLVSADFAIEEAGTFKIDRFWLGMVVRGDVLRPGKQNRTES